MTTTTEAKTYQGGCHCHAVRYQVKLALEGALTCNCSICQKTGTALVFVPASAFEQLAGDDALTDYLWGKKHIHFLFCKVCGIRSFARGKMPDGSDMVAVNVRCLDDVDFDALSFKKYDGKSR